MLCVALGFLAIGYLVLQIPSARAGLWTFPGAYQITARFGDIGDLRPGAPVTMAGVRVGRVTNHAQSPSRQGGRDDEHSRPV